MTRADLIMEYCNGSKRTGRIGYTVRRTFHAGTGPTRVSHRRGALAVVARGRTLEVGHRLTDDRRLGTDPGIYPLTVRIGVLPARGTCDSLAPVLGGHFGCKPDSGRCSTVSASVSRGAAVPWLSRTKEPGPGFVHRPRILLSPLRRQRHGGCSSMSVIVIVSDTF